MLLLLLLLLLGCCSGAAAWQTLTINVATAVPANRTIQAETSLLFTNGECCMLCKFGTAVPNLQSHNFCSNSCP
eukprot:SAG31_NODE_103_length_25164_cov_12.124317_11_plen_74_part_00